MRPNVFIVDEDVKLKDTNNEPKCGSPYKCTGDRVRNQPTILRGESGQATREKTRQLIFGKLLYPKHSRHSLDQGTTAQREMKRDCRNINHGKAKS